MQAAVACPKRCRPHLLAQASFGPTREALTQLSAFAASGGFLDQLVSAKSRIYASCSIFSGQTSHADWILEQMNLPVESLREYYRERVNPFYNDAVDSSRDFKPYSPCTPGSRWREFVFTLGDNRKQIQVASEKIFVEGKFRSDIRTGLLGSRWSGVPASLESSRFCVIPRPFSHLI